ncbi:Uncharacterised protein [Janthinobacterium lividum]|nr:Uncharacterised protein [Janthinobacterium lividum]
MPVRGAGFTMGSILTNVNLMPRSYFWTMLFLILHQIDAAYWKEWEMFHLPGGVQGFLVFNLAAIALVLAGYRHVLLATARATLYACVCAALGVGTFLIHAGFALAGLEQFHLPLSMAIIALCLASAVCLLRDLRRVQGQLARQAK